VLLFELELISVDGDLAAGTAKPKPALAPVSNQPPPPPPPPPPEHAVVGARVLVVGLNAKPQYNGQVGTVLTWDGAKGRAGVKLDSGDGGAGLMLKCVAWLESAWLHTS
jgi:hypothetical protein